MGELWSNWSGAVQFEPRTILRPGSEEELQAVVRKACRDGVGLRPVGAGHSSSRLVETPDMLVSLERMSGLGPVDASGGVATILPGTTLKDAGNLLLKHGLAFENMGDVDTQHVAGAFSTGTHGSGLGFKQVGANLAGARVVSGDGEIVATGRTRNYWRRCAWALVRWASSRNCEYA